MINSIIKSIAAALHTEFGDGYTIYTENVRQGLKEPCFFIACVNPSSRLFVGRKYFRENLFCIQYLPATERPKVECNGIAEQLYLCLESIEVDGDTIRGTKMHYEIADGVLHFFCNYDLFVYRRAQAMDPMESITEDIKVKNGCNRRGD